MQAPEQTQVTSDDVLPAPVSLKDVMTSSLQGLVSSPNTTQCTSAHRSLPVHYSSIFAWHWAEWAIASSPHYAIA